MFFQLSIDKNGVVSGAYQNVLSGEKSPISGQLELDKKTQRVAWKIGAKNTVIETGLQNLFQDVASYLVHFGPHKTETWLLARQKQPEMRMLRRQRRPRRKDFSFMGLLAVAAPPPLEQPSPKSPWCNGE
jgi:hypothetical protein